LKAAGILASITTVNPLLLSSRHRDVFLLPLVLCLCLQRANADWLRSNPSARVEIEGHCDERGTNEYNLALGAKRAQAAREFLSSLGISPDRLSTISYGEEIPVCREHDEQCWKQNRRARFVILQGRTTS